MNDAEKVGKLIDKVVRQSAEIAVLKAELESLCKWPMHKKVELRNRYYANKKLRQADLAAESGVSVAYVSKIIRQADAYLATPHNHRS